jgi:hypothetical protein
MNSTIAQNILVPDAPYRILVFYILISVCLIFKQTPVLSLLLKKSSIRQNVSREEYFLKKKGGE